jgi:phosphatidylglycerol:prolipoprotein diacylglycerol transferase
VPVRHPLPRARWASTAGEIMHPILFRFGDVVIGTYGVLAFVAIASGFACARLCARELRVPEVDVWRFGGPVLFATVIGCKTLGLAVAILIGSHASSLWTLQQLRSAGAVHGGMLGGPLCILLMRRYASGPLRDYLDVGSAPAALAMALGRLACFGAGCCYGTPANARWASVVFHDVEAGRLGTPLDTPLHPVQLYACATGLAAFALLLLLTFRRPFPGSVISTYFIIEGFTRTVLETWRGDADRGVWLGLRWLSTGRVTGGLLIAGGFCMLAWFRSARAAQSYARRGVSRGPGTGTSDRWSPLSVDA